LRECCADFDRSCWQVRARPRNPAGFKDGLRVNIRSDGVVSNKVVLVALAIQRDVLGLWCQATEVAVSRPQVQTGEWVEDASGNHPHNGLNWGLELELASRAYQGQNETDCVASITRAGSQKAR
jgi:hypothetical protein